MQHPDESLTTPLTSTSQFIQADEDDDFDEESIPGFSHPAMEPTPRSATMQDKGKGRQADRLATPTGESSFPRSPLAGNIGSTPNGAPKPNRTTIGGVRVETRFTGGDTLDEPISTTIVRASLAWLSNTHTKQLNHPRKARDLLSIYTKLIQVLYPPRSGSSREVLRDWDLWGPLVLCLMLGILLSINAPANQSLAVFTSVVVIISLGSLVVTVQAKLLGGRVSFFQGLCALGYCVAPLNIAALVSTFVHQIYVRAPIALFAWAWCIWASVNFLDGTKIEQQRILLAVYPLLLFYFTLAWMIIVQ
ncbi:Yip1-domain-containing protein [Cristinia sonorae]|uniref:Protein YIP n=1 Tax=Cristinia sonorae TaxID=1940300 RepID=A0A8K0UK40_9AGAR|nr:Yip1-domain-containing protein [Cristinia sonorae]